MSRYVDLDEKVTAQFYDEQYEEWTMQTVTIEDVLESVCDEHTVLPSTQPEGKKGVFIPDITVEMLRKASLEAVEDLLTSGEMKDIVLPSAQPYTEEQIQKMQDLEQAQLEEAYRRGRESAQPKIGKWVYGSPVTVKCNQCGFYIPDWEAHSSRFCRNCGAKMEG